MKKIIFFVEGFNEFRGTEAEKLLLNCGVKYWIKGTGVDLVIILVEDDRQEGCVLRALEMSGVDYIYEMDGVPRELRYRSVFSWRTLAEVRFV